MNKNDIWQQFEYSLKTDKKIFPYWPEHIAGKVLKIQDPIGQISIAANRLKYGSPESDEALKQQMKNSAIEVMVQAYRFLENSK